MRASQSFILGLLACIYGTAKISDSKEARIAASFVSVLLVLVTLFLRKWRKTNNSQTADGSSSQNIGHLPGPIASDPKSGNISDIKRAGSVHQYITAELSSNYGPIGSFHWGQLKVAYISSPTVISDAANQEQLCSLNRKPLPFYHGLQPLIGDNCIQFCNGNVYDFKMKTIFSPIYGAQSGKKVIDSDHKSIWKELIGKWLGIIDRDGVDSAETNQTIDIAPDLFESVTKSMMWTIFGSVPHDESEQTAKDIMSAFQHCFQRIEGGSFVHWDASKMEKERKNLRKKLIFSLHKMMDLKSSSSGSSSGNAGDSNECDLVSILQRNATLYPNRECIVNELIVILFGAHKLYHGLLALCQWIANHHAVQEEMVHEIKMVMNGDDEVERLETEFVAKMMELKQCRSVIVKALSEERYLMPWTARVCNTKDLKLQTTTLDGTAAEVTIPRGMPIILLSETMKDTEWNGCRGTIFGGLGDRGCPGAIWTERVMLLFMTLLLPKLRLSSNEPNEVHQEEHVTARGCPFKIVNGMQHPLRLKLTLR